MEGYQITYRLDYNPPRITCLLCNMTSHNPYDIAYFYCGNCRGFHNLKTDDEGNVIPDIIHPTKVAIIQ